MTARAASEREHGDEERDAGARRHAFQRSRGKNQATRIVYESHGDLSRAAGARQDRDRRGRGGRSARARRLCALRRRPRARRVGRGHRPRGSPYPPRAAGVAHRGTRPRQGPRARRLLLGRLPLGVRGEGARRPRLRERRLARRRVHRLEAERLPDRDAPRAHARPAPPLLAPPADSRGRRGRPGASARPRASC